MAKKLLVVYTGGTVGMEPSKRGLQPADIAQFSRRLLSLPELNNGNLPAFDLYASEPVLDSASMKPHDWLRIALDVATRYVQYDGFLLLVGTDTMPYIASALSFFLENIGKPVIFTGSQYPLSHANSDGPANVIGALRLLQQAEDLFEVAIYFNGSIIRGNRADKISATDIDAIASPRFPPIGHLEDGVLHLRKDLILAAPKNSFNLTKYVQNLPHISCLRVFPGLDPDLLNSALAPKVRGLVLETYGAGNAPNDIELLKILERAHSRDVVVLNTTLCFRGRVDLKRYQAGWALREAGVIGGGDMTTAAAYTKLLYLLVCGHSAAEIRRLLCVNLRGELTTVTQ